MLNSVDFIKRLEILMDQFELTPSVFAEKIGVQRSSISHLLSGRNKPSLEFVLKIIDVFPDVNLYWLLNGDDTHIKAELSTKDTPTPSTDSVNFETVLSDQLLSKIKEEPTIQKIIFLYEDGTFSEFKAK